MAASFKGAHFPASAILYAVFFYVRYAVSYRDLQEIKAERGVTMDRAAAGAQAATSWRANETYIQVKERWTYLY